jgi:hypothetical protein
MIAKLKNKAIFVFITLTLLFSATAYVIFRANSFPSNLVINEILINNFEEYPDEDFDYPSWIEIWNPTTEAAFTNNLQLIFDGNIWQFPDGKIDPGDYILIWASEKNRSKQESELHADFIIPKTGGTLSLFSEERDKIIDKIAIPPLNTNISIGRDSSSPRNICFFVFPSPLEKNVRECFKNLNLGKPEFSHQTGTYNESFLLKITPNSKKEIIIYTLDGSYPDLISNKDNTFIYEEPLLISEASNKALSSKWFGVDRELPKIRENQILKSGVVVRARTKFSAESSALYLFSTFTSIDLPIVSLTMDNDFLINPESGFYTAGEQYEDYLKSSDFNENLKSNFPANFFERGRDWERPLIKDSRNAVIFEYCVNSECLSKNVGIRNHGTTTRRLPMKSIRLYAREEFGAKYFEYNFFPDQQIDRYRRLILRNSGQDWGVTLLADATYQAMVKTLKVDTQNYQPVVLFLNGEYWGIHNLRERYDRFYFSEKYGLDSNSVSILDSFLNLQEGRLQDALEYKNFIKYISQYPYGDKLAIRAIEETIDLENYIDYMIAQTFFAPYDWPGNNQKLWKSSSENSEYDRKFSKWRWVIMDLDYAGHMSVDHATGINSYEYYVERIESTEYAVRNGIDYDPYRDAGVSLILTHILSDEELKARFLSRYQEILSNELSPESIVEVLNKNRNLIKSEIPRHIERWSYPKSFTVWDSYVDELEKFLTIRSKFMDELIRDKYL